MEEQIPPSQQPLPYQLTPEQLSQIKANAKEAAIRQTVEQNLKMLQQPKVVYVRRNLTVAELLLLLFLASGLVVGAQTAWDVGSSLLTRIEVKVK